MGAVRFPSPVLSSGPVLGPAVLQKWPVQEMWRYMQGVGDGTSTYGTFVAPVVLAGDFSITFEYAPILGSAHVLLSGGSTGHEVYVNADGTLAWYYNNASLGTLSSTAMTVGYANTIKLVRSGTSVTCTLNGATKSTVTVSGAVVFNGAAKRYGAASLYAKGNLLSLSIRDYTARGPELVTNGSFDTDTGWTKGTGWSIANGESAHIGGAGYLQQPIGGVVAGRLYAVTCTSTGSKSILGTGSFVSDNLTLTSGVTYFVSAINNQLDIYNNGTGAIQDISIREVLTDATGTLTHYPLNAGGRPASIPEWCPNLLSYSGDFSNAAWTKTGAAVVFGGTAPDGTPTAFTLTEGSGGTYHFARSASVTLPAGSTYTFSAYAKSNGRSWVALADATNGQVAFFDLATGAVGNTAFVQSAGITAVGNSWYRCSITFVSNAGAQVFDMRVASANGTDNYSGDGASGVYIWGAQLEPGSTASGYIRTGSAANTTYYEYDTTCQLYALPAGEQLGAEKVTNGGFDDGVSGWTAQSGWSVSSGAAVHSPGVVGSIYQSAMTVGKLYLISFSVNSISGSWVRFNYGAAGINRSAAGTYHQVVIAAGELAEIQADSGTACSIDNISVRELPTNSILWANLPVPQQYTRNGNAWVGPDLVANGRFYSDTAWTKNGWTISSEVGSASALASGAALVQSILTTGARYEHKFDVTTFTSGSVKAQTGSGALGTARSAVGRYAERLTCTTSTAGGVQTASAGTSLSVDNVSIRHILEAA